MSAPIRLRRGVRVTVTEDLVRLRDIAAEVELRGLPATRLWNAVESMFVEGFEEDALLASITATRPRVAIEQLIDSLAREGLLQEVEAGLDPALLDALSADVLLHLERRARRPRACALRLLDARIELNSHDGALTDEIVRLLELHGISVAVPGTPETVEPVEPGPALVAQLTLELDHERRCVDVRTTGGLTVVGPVPARRGSDETVELRDLPIAPRTAGRDLLHRRLVAAHVLICVLDSIVQHDEAAAGSRDASILGYFVTDSRTTAERRTAVAPSVLRGVDAGPLRLAVSAAADERDGDAVAGSTWVESAAPLWDPVLGVVGDPQPRELPQSPFGLAVIDANSDAPRFGAGPSTTEARWDAFTAAYRHRLGLGRNGLGISARHAATDAIGRDAYRHASWGPTGELDGNVALSPDVHRGWARLLLEHGLAPTVRLGVARAGTVNLAEIECLEATAVGIGSSIDRALIAAISRLEALVHLRRSVPGAVAQPWLCTAADLEMLEAAGPEPMRVSAVPGTGVWLAEPTTSGVAR